ncbi:hypothetical protein HMPREF1068_04046 [Bacteroides nordii CL02T12C05]|uniref:Uncharacterized protein n=1 Tax=Bacteroides nordii CL02T12C05 TaxID=997884 RepID=I9RMB9_9BACE|nr:hypothetical protein HMPREF1068_04046 [Bacteroides nordii CL02T12C05]
MSCNKSGEENFLNFLFIVIPLLLVELGGSDFFLRDRGELLT